MEIWGGIECTINRVGDNYFNQLDFQGHYDRQGDLKLLADLGIKKIRYPILWEKHQRMPNQQPEWTEIEGNLNYLRERGVDVIAGLVHHGSGPAYARIDGDSFAEGLAAYAASVASKFPWVEYYTPVNEPLTTARFCGLYGFWFPHQTSDYSFLRILLNECKATVLAMAAICKVNPRAKLVQTEDLGKTHSTPALAYQATFENHRRWLSIDLLCGKVDVGHYMYDYCIEHGITNDELRFFIDNPCPPDLLGINYYITSERYLDEKMDNYPVNTHGGNGRMEYADVEAVRVKDVELAGHVKQLRDAWERFHLPIAITEAHLYCGREDQLRWIKTSYAAVKRVEEEGVEIRALTIWSMFGAYGWDTLLTQPGGNYESGVYDVRTGQPRPTALERMVRSLAKGEEYIHPIVQGKGWWDRDERIIYPIQTQPCGSSDLCLPILIIGATGTLGRAFAKVCLSRNIHFITLTRAELNLNDKAQIEQVIQTHKPWAVINAAGFVRVDDAEIEFQDCFLSNTEGPANLADACRRYGVKLLTFSSDLVFDGKKQAAYDEDDAVNPLNVYGESKARAEERVLSNNPDALVIRTSAFFSPWDNYNFVSYVTNALNEKRRVDVLNDVFISPTYVPDLVHASMDLLIDDEKGIWHLSNEGTVSWGDLALEVAVRGKYNSALLQPVSIADIQFPAKRPTYSALTSKRGVILPSLDKALDKYFTEINIAS